MIEPTRYYCFTSELFEIEENEGDMTNPGLYGKQLSHWLADNLGALGYRDAEAIPEDWGWSVICQRKPYLLWVACGNSEALEKEDLEKNPPVVWECFVGAEVPFWRKLFKKLETTESERQLNDILMGLLSKEPRIQFVECP